MKPLISLFQSFLDSYITWAEIKREDKRKPFSEKNNNSPDDIMLWSLSVEKLCWDMESITSQKAASWTQKSSPPVNEMKNEGERFKSQNIAEFSYQ